MTDWTPWTAGPEADRWSALYEQAVAWGGRSGEIAEAERLQCPLELIAMATERLPALALLMPALVCRCAGREDLDRPVVLDGWRLAGEFVRLASRALESHARDVGYVPGEWIVVGVVHARVTTMIAVRRPRPLHHLEDATEMISTRSTALPLVASQSLQFRRFSPLSRDGAKCAICVLFSRIQTLERMSVPNDVRRSSGAIGLPTPVVLHYRSRAVAAM